MDSNKLYLKYCLNDVLSESPTHFSEYDEEKKCTKCNDSFYHIYVSKSSDDTLCAICFGEEMCEIVEVSNKSKILIEKSTYNILYSENQEEIIERRTESDCSDSLAKLKI